MDAVGANWFAYLVILAWPLVALLLYATRQHQEATAWTVLGALMLLPQQASIKIPMVPPFDKGTIASIAAIIGCVVYAPSQGRIGRGGWLLSALAVLYVVSPVVTSILNNDAVVAGPLILPGVDYYDGVSALLSQAILFAPLLIGRKYFTDHEGIRVLLRVLVIAALIYTMPMLYEIRMSPQLSRMIYGTFSSSFPVEMRYGGYRPVVFMQNGLAAAFLLATAILAAIAFWRSRARVTSIPPGILSGYLAAVLVLCKSAGALIYAVLVGALVRWAKPQVQIRLAVIVACIAIAYPALRITDLVPTEQIIDLAESINQDRASSLKTRFDQEQQLLAHASERFWFGWGRYGRNRVYDKYGSDISITDGQWIITFGQFGLVGFIAQFGLLVFPVFSAARAFRYIDSEGERVLFSCLVLIVSLSAFEQIPNASVSGWSWLLAGALFGRSARIMSRAESYASRRRKPVASAVPSPV
jgi:hypothetical protein